jgi:DNA mismatch repair protein MutS
MQTSTTAEETPLMQQYNRIKSKYPDALLLFRVGDFYEMFGEDAVKASKVLDIVLTKRKNGAAAHIELAGFPYHALETYLPRLVRAGNRVAICDQLEDPKTTKKIVKRGVTELVTPGITFNDAVLDGKSNNFLAAWINEGPLYGLAFLDFSTGEFLVAQGNKEHAEKLMLGFRPSEVLLRKSSKSQSEQELPEKLNTFTLDDWACTTTFGEERLCRHFQVPGLKGFGIEDLPLAVAAAGAVLYYLEQTHHEAVGHITSVSRIDEDRYVWLDRFTIRNLELTRSNHEGGTSLLDVLDNTLSPMGSRLLKRWVVMPLKDLDAIDSRLSVVDYLMRSDAEANQLAELLAGIGDLERLVSKASAQRINPRELKHLGTSLELLIPMKALFDFSDNPELRKISADLSPCSPLLELIQSKLADDPPALLLKGGVIKSGVNPELDELRAIAYSGKDYLIELQQREAERTGISSLKVSFNNVFGYYIEVRNTYKDKVPAEWIRKQTLTQAERYITEELKEYESKILGAEEKIASLEAREFEILVGHVTHYLSQIQRNCRLLATLDCLLCFARNAVSGSYVRPRLNPGLKLHIEEGRHPVIERFLPPGEEYVSNSILLDPETQQILMITGPNMSGKSALLRQTALIALMAQMGSFVPARSADIGIVDKIFTRVGASDNISGGESTFMVEMNETASILNNLSPRSLILLDEIGRGTSTYDGISIAWSIAEYIHENPKSKARTLFATHYHELNDMCLTFPRIKNFNVSVREAEGRIIFLRKLSPGGSNHSFGIHVARLAGMPKEVLVRSEQVLLALEKSHSGEKISVKPKPSEDLQLSFFQLDDPILEQVKNQILETDIDSLTPIEALNKLYEIRKMVTGRSR